VSDTPLSRSRWRALAPIALFALVALVALVAGCSSSKHDSGRKPASTTTARRAPAGLAERVAQHPCEVLDRVTMAKVTGLRLRTETSAPSMCGFATPDEVATVPVRYAVLGPVTPALAVSTSTATCDDDTVTLVHLDHGDEGFICTVTGVATLGATGQGVYGVVMFGALAADTPPPTTLKALVTTLHDALISG
jgi:hypothetical protein